MNRNKVVIGSALLAALSLVFQFLPLFYKFGDIRIDLVGFPWILSSLAFGLSGGLLTSVISSIVLVFTPSGWVGATAKFLATVPMVVVFGLLKLKGKTALKFLFAGFIFATVFRAIFMSLFNYFFAFPVFWGVPVEEALNYPLELIVLPNIFLSVIEFSLAYFVLFKTKLRSRLNA